MSGSLWQLVFLADAHIECCRHSLQHYAVVVDSIALFVNASWASLDICRNAEEICAVQGTGVNLLPAVPSPEERIKPAPSSDSQACCSSCKPEIPPAPFICSANFRESGPQPGMLTTSLAWAGPVQCRAGAHA